MRKLISFAVVLSISLFSLNASPIQRDEIYLSADPLQKIEIITSMPEGCDAFPLLMLFHGVSMKNGGNDFSPEIFQLWGDKDIAVAAVSLPGFGSSSGYNDFCGPYTIQALNAVIDHLKQEMPITSIGAVGFGIGALAATLLSSQRNDLSCVVSVNGGYDLKPLVDENNALRKALEKNKTAMDFTETEINVRSPMECASKIRSPLFLLHRRLNPIVTLEEVLLFVKKVENCSGDCTAVFLEGGDLDSKISSAEVVTIAGEWIEKHLKVSP